MKMPFYSEESSVKRLRKIDNHHFIVIIRGVNLIEDNYSLISTLHSCFLETDSCNGALSGFTSCDASFLSALICRSIVS